MGTLNRIGRTAVSVVALLALSFPPAGASAQQLQCEPDMFKDFLSSQRNLAETLHLLKIVDTTNFSELKQGFNGNITLPIDGVPVDFGATYDSFDQKRTEVFSKHQTDYTKDESLADLQITFSTNSLSAYRGCLDAYVHSQIGLHLVATDVRDDAATIRVSYQSPPGEAKPLDVEIQSRGVSQPTVMSIRVKAGGEKSFIVDRLAKSDMRLTANGGGYSPSLMIPRLDSIPSMPCKSYKAGHPERKIACNDKTADGYYWEIGDRSGEYASGVDNNGIVPACDGDHDRGRSNGHSARFPYSLSEPGYQPVYDKVWPRDRATEEQKKCIYEGQGQLIPGAVPRHDICGVFVATCQKQP